MLNGIGVAEGLLASFDSNTDASWQAYYAFIKDSLLAAGFVQTADPQADPATVTKAASSSGVNAEGPKLFFAFNDAYQATFPIVFSMNLFFNNSFSRLGIDLTVGSATDSAGNFVGVTESFRGRHNSSTGTASNVINVLSYFDGGFILQMGRTSSGSAGNIVMLMRPFDMAGNKVPGAFCFGYNSTVYTGLPSTNGDIGVMHPDATVVKRNYAVGAVPYEDGVGAATEVDGNQFAVPALGKLDNTPFRQFPMMLMSTSIIGTSHGEVRNIPSSTLHPWWKTVMNSSANSFTNGNTMTILFPTLAP